MHALEVSFALLCWKERIPRSSNGFSGMLVGLNSTSFPYLQGIPRGWISNTISLDPSLSNEKNYARKGIGRPDTIVEASLSRSSLDDETATQLRN